MMFFGFWLVIAVIVALALVLWGRDLRSGKTDMPNLVAVVVFVLSGLVLMSLLAMWHPMPYMGWFGIGRDPSMLGPTMMGGYYGGMMWGGAMMLFNGGIGLLAIGVFAVVLVLLLRRK